MMIEFYFTKDPTKSVTNGNEAFIPIALLTPFLLLSILITWTVGRKYFATIPLQRPWLLFLLIALILLISISGEYQLVRHSISKLNGTWNDSNSIIFKKGAFNSYTNNWYFNENSFLFTHLMAFLLGFVGRKKEWQIEEKENTTQIIEEEK